MAIYTRQSAEEMISALYRGVLRREPDPVGLAEHTARLLSGVSLQEVIGAFVTCHEFTAQQIRTGFFAHKPVCTLLRNRLRLWVDLADRYVSFACLAEEFEPQETAFVLAMLAPGDTFLDVGANIGWFTILAAEKVTDTGRVYAFEPRRDTFQLLTRSIHENGFEERCEAMPIALGEALGTGRLLFEPDSGNPGHTWVGEYARPPYIADAGAVEIRPLDSFPIIGPVSVIKLDVEGAEPRVLTGGATLIHREQPYIVSEVFGSSLVEVSGMTPADYLAFIHGMGYRAFALVADGRGPEIVEPAVSPFPYSWLLIPETRLGG